MRTDKSFIHYDLDYHTQRSEEPEFGTADINMVSEMIHRRGERGVGNRG